MEHQEQSHHRPEQFGAVRIEVDDLRGSEHRDPVTIRIVVREKSGLVVEKPLPPSPLVRVIHADELAKMTEDRRAEHRWEDEPMGFGESVILLIVIGVLIYLIYALLWPERF